ncbi:MAG: hypothetical protein GF364_22585 [Candidatus Lokiarchaeota archaeon]|nr:hypothetical protein [Candidatus Lokiarchaeota archaeon]
MWGRVLVVENTTPYAEQACRQLQVMGISAKAVPAPDEFNEFRALSERRYREAVLGKVRSYLGEENYDVIVVNLHLLDDGDHVLEGGDYLGIDVLQEAIVRQPSIYQVICTGHKGRDIFFLDRYPDAEIVHKEADQEGIRGLCEAVRKVLVQGYPVRKRIEERPYELKGVNSQIYRFLHNSGVIFRTLSMIDDYDDRLVRALSGDLEDERLGETEKYLRDLWNLEAGLPVYPLIRKLGTMECDRVFWKEHRDHVRHTLLVYLLGLYFYYGSSGIREALDSEMSEAEFLLAWKITALFHDLGYVFEVEYEEKGKTYEAAFEELNNLRKGCLYHYAESRGLSVLKAENDRIRKQGKIYIDDVDSEQIETLTTFGDLDLFAVLEPSAGRACLGERGNSLREYWNYAMSNSTWDRGREGYVDHGIAGALVLLQQFHSLKDFVEKAKLKLEEESELVSSKTAELIRELNEEVEEYETAVHTAASAIALHNINVDNWDHSDAYIKSGGELTLNQYRLSLKNIPLAFLLALSDNLQSWGRPKYSYPEESQYAAQAQDVAIGFDEEKIVITYKTDPLQSTEESLFSKKIEQMSHYMLLDDLNLLLRKGTLLSDS